MALNIRSAEASRLVAEVAALAGETKTQAVILALKERLQRQRDAAPDRVQALVHRLDQIALRCAARPVHDHPVSMRSVAMTPWPPPLLMVIDSSAVLAILQNEPERRAFNQAIAAAEQCAMSPATFVELSIVMEARFGPDGQGDLDQDQAQLAREAFSHYGKGRHRAGLNFGDCFS